MNDRLSSCRRCDADIRWARSQNDRWVPMEPHVVPSSGVAKKDWRVLLEEGDELYVHAMRSDAGDEPVAVWITHFLTCPYRQPPPRAEWAARLRWEQHRMAAGLPDDWMMPHGAWDHPRYGRFYDHPSLGQILAKIEDRLRAGHTPNLTMADGAAIADLIREHVTVSLQKTERDLRG